MWKHHGRLKSTMWTFRIIQSVFPADVQGRRCSFVTCKGAGRFIFTPSLAWKEERLGPSYSSYLNYSKTVLEGGQACSTLKDHNLSLRFCKYFSKSLKLCWSNTRHESLRENASLENMSVIFKSRCPPLLSLGGAAHYACCWIRCDKKFSQPSLFWLASQQPWVGHGWYFWICCCFYFRDCWVRPDWTHRHLWFCCTRVPLHGPTAGDL